VLWGHVPWYERRGSIGKVAPHTPDWLDYDLYCGPAPVKPLRRKKLHYDWHWVWSTGTGDLGNSGIHAFDVCRWFAGYEGLPPRAICIGGRFGVDDAGETPNTQLTVLDYKPAPIFIENRNLPVKKGDKAMDHFRGIREGVVLQCENGYFAGFRGGGWAYDNQGKKIRQFKGDGGGAHQANFIRAVRERNAGLLNAPIEKGHVSSAACHLGNLSYRLAAGATPARLQELTRDFKQVGRTLDAPMALGPWLAVDADTEEIAGVTGSDLPDVVAEARRLAHGSYRRPFVVPERV